MDSLFLGLASVLMEEPVSSKLLGIVRSVVLVRLRLCVAVIEKVGLVVH